MNKSWQAVGTKKAIKKKTNVELEEKETQLYCKVI